MKGACRPVSCTFPVPREIGDRLSGFASAYKAAKAVVEIAVGTCQVRRKSSVSGPPRILHLIETGGPGGAEQMIFSLIRNLGAGYQSVMGLVRQGWLESRVKASGIPYALLGDGGLGDLNIIAHLLRVVREYQIQLIHSHEFYMNAMGATVSRLTGIPLVATVHGRNYYSEQRRRRAVYRIVAAQAAGVVAVSQDLRQFFCQTTGVRTNQVQVIYNGIDTRSLSNAKREPQLLESLGIPPGASIVGTVGNLYPIKGHVHLISATRTILQHQPDTHVLILGRGRLLASLSAEAEGLGIQDRIHLLGYRDDVSGWLMSMDVFALPSLSEGAAAFVTGSHGGGDTDCGHQSRWHA